MSRQALAVCTRIAASQHGVLSAAQAAEAGLSRPAIRRLVRSAAWERVRPCVYALWIPARPDLIWRHRLTAAALWLAPRGAASHRAAALVWELDGVAAAPIELSTTGRHRSSEPGLVVHHVKSLRPDDVVIRDGIPVTAPPRTLLDLCAVVAPRAVEAALECVMRRRLASVDQIVAVISRSTGSRRGRGVLDALVGWLPREATESALEVLVWRLLRGGGLPLPARQHEVRDATGVLIARVDFAYPRERIAIEADGHEFHSRKSDWQRDRARQNALTRLGWKVYRVTWEDATLRGGTVVADIAALLAVAREHVPHSSQVH